MKKPTSNFVDFIKKHKVLSIATAAALVLCCWWAMMNFLPHPLGDKLEYLGKKDLGGIIFSDSEPYSIYYYATDMSVTETERYFRQATVEYPSEDMGAYTQIWLKGPSAGQSAQLYYHSSSSINGYRTTKKSVVEIRSDDYAMLSAALK